MNNKLAPHPVKPETDRPGLSVSPYLTAEDENVFQRGQRFGDPDRPVELHFYRNDVVLKDPTVRMHPRGHHDGPKRGKICRLSPKSQKRMAFVANNTEVSLKGLLTLTYQADIAPKNGRIAKKHLDSFLKFWRRSEYGQYLWFLEFTKNETVHFHMFTELAPAFPRIKVDKGAEINLKETRFFSQRWAEIVGAGGKAQEKMSRVSARFEAVRDIDGAGRYASKYAFKREQKLVPLHYHDVGRFWGASRALKPTPHQETTITAKEAYERFKAFYVEERDFHYFYGIQHGAAKDERTNDNA